MIVMRERKALSGLCFSTIDYEFRDWLLAQGKTRWTIREIVIYTKRFSHISDTGDASPLLKLSPSNK